MTLGEALAELTLKYAFERTKAFSNSAFGQFVRHDIAEIAKQSLPFGFTDFSLKSSVGNGNWASVPWLAFFDPLVTTTAQEGIYVVFLINPDSKIIYLSLMQGTTAVRNEFKSRYIDVLKRRAADMRERVHDIAKAFPLHEIDLGSDDDLPKGYMAGHSVGKCYSIDEIVKADLVGDLEAILKVYHRLINRGGTLPSDLMLEEAETHDIIEARRYILSKRIERSSKVRQAVLSIRPSICEGCGLNPKLDYKFEGPVNRVPLDVHHIAALSGLAENEFRRYRVPQDFLVLCPTCHRVIHTLKDESDLGSLQDLIKFKHMREL